jgi:hypothetical protein
MRVLVQAVDPLVLPLFLEPGSILFFTATFPRSTIAQPLQPAIETIAQPLHHCARVFTKQEARQNLKRLRQAGSGRYLAARWGRDLATVSRWLAEWAEDGTIAVERRGKTKRALTVSKSCRWPLSLGPRIVIGAKSRASVVDLRFTDRSFRDSVPPWPNRRPTSMGWASLS